MTTNKALNHALQLSLVSVLLLSGCEKDHRGDALKVLKAQGATRLRADAQQLASRLGPKSVGMTPIAPALLPTSFTAFAPVMVRDYEPGFGILVDKWVSHEVGIYVVPAGSTYEPKSSSPGGPRYEKISDGVYWYEM